MRNDDNKNTFWTMASLSRRSLGSNGDGNSSKDETETKKNTEVFDKTGEAPCDAEIGKSLI